MKFIFPSSYGIPAKIPYLLKICIALCFLNNALELNTKDI